MKRRIQMLFTLFLLLGFATQPVLAQVRAARDATPPCPMQMAQQMDHQGMAQHGDCAGHANKLCADCDLCGHAGSSTLPASLSFNAMPNGKVLAAPLHSAVVSIALPVDSPPPRNL